jgi:hypothetical protein
MSNNQRASRPCGIPVLSEDLADSTISRPRETLSYIPRKPKPTRTENTAIKERENAS